MSCLIFTGRLCPNGMPAVSNGRGLAPSCSPIPLKLSMECDSPVAVVDTGRAGVCWLADFRPSICCCWASSIFWRLLSWAIIKSILSPALTTPVSGIPVGDEMPASGWAFVVGNMDGDGPAAGWTDVEGGVPASSWAGGWDGVDVWDGVPACRCAGAVVCGAKPVSSWAAGMVVCWPASSWAVVEVCWPASSWAVVEACWPASSWAAGVGGCVAGKGWATDVEGCNSGGFTGRSAFRAEAVCTSVTNARARSVIFQALLGREAVADFAGCGFSGGATVLFLCGICKNDGRVKACNLWTRQALFSCSKWASKRNRWCCPKSGGCAFILITTWIAASGPQIKFDGVALKQNTSSRWTLIATCSKCLEHIIRWFYP